MAKKKLKEPPKAAQIQALTVENAGLKERLTTLGNQREAFRTALVDLLGLTEVEDEIRRLDGRIDDVESEQEWR